MALRFRISLSRTPTPAAGRGVWGRANLSERESGGPGGTQRRQYPPVRPESACRSPCDPRERRRSLPLHSIVHESWGLSSSLRPSLARSPDGRITGHGRPISLAEPRSTRRGATLASWYVFPPRLPALFFLILPSRVVILCRRLPLPASRLSWESLSSLRLLAPLLHASPPPAAAMSSTAPTKDRKSVV